MSDAVLRQLEYSVGTSSTRQRNDLDQRAEHIQQLNEGIHGILSPLDASHSLAGVYSFEQMFALIDAASQAEFRDVELRMCPPKDAATLLDAIERLDEAAAFTILSNSGFYPNVRDAKGHPAFHSAASSGLGQVCAAMLRRRDFQLLNGRVQGNFTALHCAASSGNAWICLAILDHPSFTSANAQSSDGSSALHIAARNGHEEACEALLSHPCFEATAANAADASSCTALHIAAMQGHTQVCRVLLGHSKFTAAAARDLQGRTAFHWASVRGDISTMQELLMRSEVVDLSAKDNAGDSALVLARDSETWHLIYHACDTLLTKRTHRELLGAPAPSLGGPGPWVSGLAFRA